MGRKRLTDGERRKQNRERQRRYRERHPEKVRQQNVENSRRYRARHPERARAVAVRSLRRRRAFITRVMFGHACEICGERHPAKLQVHHRTPCHGRRVQLANRSRAFILQEIAANHVLCASCHCLVEAQANGGQAWVDQRELQAWSRRVPTVLVDQVRRSGELRFFLPDPQRLQAYLVDKKHRQPGPPD